MTPASFFAHFGIEENPFRGEEARHDAVLSRLVSGAAGLVGLGGAGALASRGAMHPELERIVGDFGNLSSAVVFGEKGSGKTAIRLQLAQALARHNALRPGEKVLLLAYDDLNPYLDRLHNRVQRAARRGKSTPAESLKDLRLVDHIDGLLATAVPTLIDAVLASAAGGAGGTSPGTSGAGSAAGATARGVEGSAGALDLGAEPRKVLRRAEANVRRDVLLLQSLYDRPEDAPHRTSALRRALGVQRSWAEFVSSLLALWGWVLPVLVVLLMVFSSPDAGGSGPVGTDAASGRAGGVAGAAPSAAGAPGSVARVVGSTTGTPSTTWQIFLETLTSPARLLSSLGLGGWDDPRTVVWSSVFFLAVGFWLVFLLRRVYTDRFRLNRLAHRVYREVRVTGRSESSLRESLRAVPARWRTSSLLPVTPSEDTRLKMLQRLRGALRLFGYRGVIAVVDRLDEPSLVQGDADKMRSVAWPLLNNKFLQQEGIGIKLLLPIELRHMLFRESSAFFQQARMDKQNLVEQLSWSGTMLYDLCTARIAACRTSALGGAPTAEGGTGGGVVTLADLFAPDVGRDLLVESLEQMRQPRDAFKMIYQCVMEHCAIALENAEQWRIPRSILELVRKQQGERVRQLAMGIRPA